MQNRGAARSLGDGATLENNPCAFGGLLDGVFPGPILDKVTAGKGFGPGNADRIDGMEICQVNNHPLRMGGIRLSGEISW